MRTWQQKMAAATSSDKESVGILVVGAGPTGLGAATRLQMLGNTDWLLLDAFDEAGGYVCSLLFSFVRKIRLILFSHIDWRAPILRLKGSFLIWAGM